MEPEVLSWDDAGNNRFILSGKGSWIHNPVSPYNAALANKQPIADDINHHNSPGGPAGIHSACPNLSMGIWKFSKNQELAKEFIAYLFQKQNFDAWIVASNAFNHPPLKNLSDHPIWARNPKFAMLPKEAEYAHPRGWPGKPNEAVQRIDDNYIMADMVAKAVNGMPPEASHGLGPGAGRAGRQGTAQGQLAWPSDRAFSKRRPGSRGPAAAHASASGGSRSISSATASSCRPSCSSSPSSPSRSGWPSTSACRTTGSARPGPSSA